MDWCSLTLAQRSSVQDYQNGGDWLHQEVYWGYGGSIEGFVTLGYGRSTSPRAVRLYWQRPQTCGHSGIELVLNPISLSPVVGPITEYYISRV